MKERVTFRKLQSKAEMLPHLELVKGLTPSLTASEYDSYLSDMIPHNYFQVIASLDDKVIGLSGYWIATKLYSGRFLEIDNFIVDERFRNIGVGAVMIEWLQNEALQNQCNYLMLDAYVENFKAHAFYYRNGFIARGFHYLKELDN